MENWGQTSTLESMPKVKTGKSYLKNKSKALKTAVKEFFRKERLKKIDLLRGNFSFDKTILNARHNER